MFNAEKLLGGLLKSGMRNKGGLGSLVSGGAGMTVVGVAMAAAEHFMQGAQAAQPVAGTVPPPMPGTAPPSAPGSVPPPAPAAAPPPVPGASTPPPPGRGHQPQLPRQMPSCSSGR